MSAVSRAPISTSTASPTSSTRKCFSGLPPYANIRSLRVAGGLGTIPRVVSDTANIYNGPLSVEEALARIERIYRPFHDTCAHLLADARRLRACRPDRLPFDAVEHPRRRGRLRPDFVLGDRFGTSCMPRAHRLAAHAAAARLHRVPQQALCGRLHHRALRQAARAPALQIEINRGLYMDETSFDKSVGV